MLVGDIFNLRSLIRSTLAASQSGSLMEVFKAAFSEGSNACDRIAIKSADGKSYSYGQLTSSALTISKLFGSSDDTTNVW